MLTILNVCCSEIFFMPLEVFLFCYNTNGTSWYYMRTQYKTVQFNCEVEEKKLKMFYTFMISQIWCAHDFKQSHENN